MEELVMNISQPEPYVLMFGDQFFLVIDCIVVTEVDAEAVPITLLSSYFVFNIKYPKGCNNLFSFLEVLLLGGNGEKLSPTVKNFFSFIVN